MPCFVRILLVTIFAVCWFFPSNAHASKGFVVLHNFCADGGSCSTDGASPNGLIADASGNFYGTTYSGGTGDACHLTTDCGTVFELLPDGTLSLLHSFCTESSCLDGSEPYSTLVSDSSGNLYGTTSAGGAFGGGTVFKLTPKGALKTLYSFCAASRCVDGEEPRAGVVLDGKGNIYGTTFNGGDNPYQGCGVIFKINSKGKEKVLYTFEPIDGCQPNAGLTLDAIGNIYGTTAYGGDYSYGVIFELTGSGTYEVLHAFCLDYPNCTDGAVPTAPVIRDEFGNLFGTTAYGGGSANGGTVFEITAGGQENVLYSFCAVSGCSDGANPVAALLLARDGRLFGTASEGGTEGLGVAFEIANGSETVIHAFDFANGYGPAAQLIKMNGWLYGTTIRGGSDNTGIAFQLGSRGD
jgi:uncharacterized repeat protein (TIGR03803 family)